MFYKDCVLRAFTKFSEKHLCQNLFFKKVAGLSSTSLKKRLWPLVLVVFWILINIILVKKWNSNLRNVTEVEEPVKYLWFIFFPKIEVLSSLHFHKEASSQMFESVLITPVTPALSVRSSQMEFLQLFERMIDLLDKTIIVIYIKLHRIF